MQTPPASPYLYLILHLWASKPITNTHINTPKQTHRLTHKESQAEENGAKGLFHTIPVFTKHIITCTTTQKSCSCQFQLYDDTIYCEAMSAIHDLPTHFDNYGASMDFHFLVASCEDCRLLPFWEAWLAQKWHWFTSFVDIYHCLHRSIPINYMYSIPSFVDLFCINCM